MKKVLSILLSVLLVSFMPVSIMATAENEAQISTVLYRADSIENSNLLLMRARMGVDERSESAKGYCTIYAETKAIELNGQAVMPEVQTTTQLLCRERLPDGRIVEEYSTVAVAVVPGTYYGSDQNSATSYSVQVFAKVNYKYVVDNSLGISFGITSTQHRAVYPSSVTVSSMYLKNEIDDSYDVLHQNTRTISSVTMGTWYTLSAPSSAVYPKSKTNLYANTTAYLPNGSESFVRCHIDCGAL